MNYRTHRLRMSGLLLAAALCLMAVSAGSALATGNWRIAGANIAAEKTVVSEEDTMFELLVPSKNFEVLCNQFIVDEGKLFITGGSLAKFLFRQCEAFTITPLVRIPACDPIGGVVTFLLKDLLILHNNKTYDLFGPDVPAGGKEEETKIGTIEFPEECGAGVKVPIRGNFVLEDCNEPLENEAVRHLLQQASTSLFPNDVLRFGNAVMTIDGSMWLKLGGAEVGKKWSGLT